MTNWKRLAAALAVLMLLAGCASTGGKGGAGSPEKRAQERWDAIIANDYVTAYTYLTPGYRSGVSQTAWESRQKRMPAERTGAEVTRFECESDEVCDVRLTIEFTVTGVLAGVGTMESENFIKEKWLLLDGQWYFAPDYR